MDESYVFCYRRRGADLLKEVRKGFGLEGLQGLEGKIAADVEDPLPGQPIAVQQRTSMQTAARNLVLPAFMIKDGQEWRPVHYEADILSQVPWEKVDVGALDALTLGEGIPGDAAFRAGLDDEQILVDENSPSDGIVGRAGVWNGSDMDYYFAAHHLRDVMPNPWRGKELAVQAFEALLKRYSAEQVAANYLLILEELRKSVEAQRDSLSQRVFHNLLDNGAMRFLVAADDLNFNRLPETIQQPANSRQANREDGSQYQLSLFERVSEDELNGLENKVATYMDRQERLFFWYRNRARSDYYVQGWKPGRIYADFIFTLRGDEPDTDDAFHRVFVVETKGLHLAHSADTTYKRSVFNICTEHARRQDWAEFVPAMRGKVMRFEVVDEQEWESRLNAMVVG